MAVAGDGQPRSDRRVRTRRLCLRVTAAEKARVTRQAREAGYSSVAAWIHDRLQPTGALSRREQAQILYWIARIGSVLSDLNARIDPIHYPHLIAPLDELQNGALTLSNMLTRSTLRVGQSHPGA